MVDDKPVGQTIPVGDGSWDVEAVVWRPRAESNKSLGVFKSRNKARQAVIAWVQKKGGKK